MKPVVLTITGQHAYDETGDDAMEFVTEGKLYDRNGTIYLTYDESYLTGMPGTRTRLKLEPDKVHMTRRGKPTVMSYLGAVPAVLVGDFWLARAVGLLSDCSDMKWTLDAFTRTLTDLSEGEMLQQQKAFTSDTTMEDYLRIIYCKTGSLFVTACQSGAKSVQASEEMIQAAGRYGKALGLAFQIRDDILDYAGDEKTGKPLGIDLLERKITLPLLGALSNSPDEQKWRQMIHEIPLHPGNVDTIRDFVLSNGGVEFAEKKLEDYVSEAEHALDIFPDCTEKEILAGIAHLNSVRTK